MAECFDMFENNFLITAGHKIYQYKGKNLKRTIFCLDHSKPNFSTSVITIKAINKNSGFLQTENQLFLLNFYKKKFDLICYTKNSNIFGHGIQIYKKFGVIIISSIQFVVVNINSKKIIKRFFISEKLYHIKKFYKNFFLIMTLHSLYLFDFDKLVRIKVPILKSFVIFFLSRTTFV